jgi:hypothetical protein
MPHLLHRLGLAITITGLLLGSIAYADDSVGKRLYRYYNDKGIPTMSDQITEEHIRRGYDIVDRNMQVIRHFPPFDEAVYQKDKSKTRLQLLNSNKKMRGFYVYFHQHVMLSWLVIAN